MKNKPPKFADLRQIEEKALLAKLEAVRKTISHAGEKGRALENEVIQLLSSFLPSEYGLSTGFVAYHTSKGIRLSSQLDIIIYDSIRGGPLARLGSCDVFPLESVYGYVEVKASIQSTSDSAKEYPHDSIEACILKNKELRAMRRRFYFKSIPGTTTGSNLVTAVWTPIRSFVFAFEGRGETANSPDKMAKRVSEFMKKTQNVHLHGVFVGGSAFYRTIPVEPSEAKPDDFYHVEYTLNHTLASFRWSVIHSLSRFPRHRENETPALEKYEFKNIRWQKYPKNVRS